jgi:hypothetical protein
MCIQCVSDFAVSIMLDQERLGVGLLTRYGMLIDDDDILGVGECLLDVLRQARS